jgi:hypothetical protein
MLSPLNRPLMALPTMTSSLPGLGARPSTIFTLGRNASASSVTPRTVTLETPDVPILSRRMTTRTSPTPTGFFEAPTCSACARTRLTCLSSTELTISVSEPLRITTTTSGLAARPSVFEMPSPSMSAHAKTKTTSARPNAAAAVVRLRTTRFRTLYLIGTILVAPSAHPPQRVRHRDAAGLDAR